VEKRCSKCGEVKSVTEFHKRTASPDGLFHWCKACALIYQKVYREGHREKIAARRKVYDAKHREEKATYNKMYHEEHREEIAANQKIYNKMYNEKHQKKLVTKRKVYCKEHREEIAARQKVYQEGHREEIATYKKIYQEEHQEKIATYQKMYREGHLEQFRTYSMQRRARKAGASGHATIEQIQARWDYYGNKCYICGKDAEAIDHVVPLAKGGSNWPANLRPICSKCNLKKSSKWPYDFKQAKQEKETTY